jgi:hypothetical protein
MLAQDYVERRVHFGAKVENIVENKEKWTEKKSTPYFEETQHTWQVL